MPKHIQINSFLFMLLTFTSTFLVSAGCLAGAGDLDRDFGKEGKLSIDLGDVYWDGISSEYSTVLQADGKIVAVGGGSGYAYASQAENIIRRFNADGSLDQSFGVNGIVHMQFDAWSSARAVALQDDGKIVVALVTATEDGWHDFVVARLLTDGSLDSAFGNEGRVIIDIERRSDDVPRAIQVLDDGRIVEAGISINNETGEIKFAIIRINQDGTLDHSFGTTGREIIDNVGYWRTANVNALEVQEDGKLLVGGQGNRDGGYYTYGFLFKLLPEGGLDASFGNNGWLIDENTTAFTAVEILPNGDILSIDYNYIVRFHNDGSLDDTFLGREILDYATRQGFGIKRPIMKDVDIQSDGKILLGGTFVWQDDYFDYLEHAAFTVLRLNADGSLDLSYGTDGAAIAKINLDPLTNGPEYSDGRALVIQSDGKSVVCGNVDSLLEKTGMTDLNFSMVRYDTTGEPDSSFGENGQVVTGIEGGTTDDTVRDIIQLQGDGKFITATQTNGPNGHDFAVIRHNADGSLDNTFNGKGWVKTDIRTSREVVEEVDWWGQVTTRIRAIVSDDYPAAIGLQPDGKIVVGGTSEVLYPGSGYEDLFALARYNPDGTLDTSFGDNGIVTTGIGDKVAFTLRSNILGDLAIQADGKIVITGKAWFDQSPPAPGHEIVTVRYNSNGSLDHSFGDGGIVVTNSYEAKKNDWGYRVLIQPDGKILVGGKIYGAQGAPDYGMSLVRYHPDGSLDAGFGNGGKVFKVLQYGDLVCLSRNLEPKDIALNVDGSIITGAEACARFVLIKYDQNGDPDLEFGEQGVALTSWNDPYYAEYLGAISMQGDGRIVAVGTSVFLKRYKGPDEALGRGPARLHYTEQDIAVTRFMPNGSIDYTFGEGGKVSTDISSSFDNANAVMIRPDAKIVVAGEALVNTSPFDDLYYHWNAALARYEGVSTTVDELEGLVYQVENWAGDNVVSPKQAETMGSLLQTAIQQIDMSHYQSALSQLEMFKNKVEALVKIGILSQEEGDYVKMVIDDVIPTLPDGLS